MEYREDDYLMISGVQHFQFCRRQWALIHIEQQWAENVHTVVGQLMHRKAHDPDFSEKRKDVIIVRALPVSSKEMGVSGECDVVEFHKCEDGVKLHGHRGLYTVYPIEYKKGKPKALTEDILQLTAQVMCLEEMFSTTIPEAALFYGETRRREIVPITEELRTTVRGMFAEMHRYYTLYVTSENSYLSLDGETIVVLDGDKEVGRVPLHNLEGIVSFGYRGTSPALMGACAERNISLSYLSPQGKFLARVTGPVKGNVLLRKTQYEVNRDEIKSLEIAKNCIIGKVYNARWVLERAIRDYGMQVDTERLKKASLLLREAVDRVRRSQSKEQLRGYEGEAASIYFGVFDELILQQKKDFFFMEEISGLHKTM